MNGRHMFLAGKHTRATREMTGNAKEATLGLRSILKETSGSCPTFKQKQMTYLIHRPYLNFPVAIMLFTNLRFNLGTHEI